MQKYLRRMYECILIGLVATPLAYFGWLFAEWCSQTGHYAIYNGVFFASGVAFVFIGIVGSIVNWRRYRCHRTVRAT